MVAAPKRRWFQFSLTTLFVVVTVFAVWLGWELSFVHQREAALLELNDSIIVFHPWPGVPPRIPHWRRFLGDKEICEILVYKELSNAEFERIRNLFQEADVRQTDKVFAD